MLMRRPLQSPWFLWLRRIKERESGCDYALRFVHSRDDMAHFTSSQVIRKPPVNCSKCSTDSSIWHKRKGSPTQAADYHDFNSRIKYSAASVGMFTCTDSPSNPESTTHLIIRMSVRLTVNILHSHNKTQQFLSWLSVISLYCISLTTTMDIRCIFERKPQKDFCSFLCTFDGGKRGKNKVFLFQSIKNKRTNKKSGYRTVMY